MRKDQINTEKKKHELATHFVQVCHAISNFFFLSLPLLQMYAYVLDYFLSSELCVQEDLIFPKLVCFDYISGIYSILFQCCKTSYNHLPQELGLVSIHHL